jgi:hypothetical protein
MIARRHSGISLPISFDMALENCGLVSGVGNNDLLTICHDTVEFVENYGAQKKRAGVEPPYHNRQHFADTCLAVSYFLRCSLEISDREKLLILLTALVHDFGHQGAFRGSKFLTQEEETVQILKNTSLNRLHEDEFSMIANFIIGTNSKNLSEINLRHTKYPSNKKYLMQSLINDADIAASFIDSLTPELSTLILKETGNLNPSTHELSIVMDAFKRNYKITTDIAKTCLGIKN